MILTKKKEKHTWDYPLPENSSNRETPKLIPHFALVGQPSDNSAFRSDGRGDCDGQDLMTAIGASIRQDDISKSALTPRVKGKSIPFTRVSNMKLDTSSNHHPRVSDFLPSSSGSRTDETKTDGRDALIVTALPFNSRNPEHSIDTSDGSDSDIPLMAGIRACLGQPPTAQPSRVPCNSKRPSILEGSLDQKSSEKAVPVQEESSQRELECSVCTDSFPLADMAASSIGSACDHSPSSPETATQRICKDCLAQHIHVQVTESGGNRIACPFCLVELTYADVKLWASEQTFTRYDTLRMRSAITTDPKFIWCSNPRCDAGQLHESGADAPIVICQACGTRTCFRHQQGWHYGMTCEEFDNPDDVAEEQEERETRGKGAERETETQTKTRRLREEEEEREKQTNEALRQRSQRAAKDGVASGGHARQDTVQKQLELRRAREERDAGDVRRIMAERERREAAQRRKERAARLAEESKGAAEVVKTTKVCPGPKCSYRVEKIDGCKHMTCSRCSFEWCWVCGKHWKTGHLNESCRPPAIVS